MAPTSKNVSTLFDIRRWKFLSDIWGYYVRVKISYSKIGLRQSYIQYRRSFMVIVFYFLSWLSCPSCSFSSVLAVLTWLSGTIWSCSAALFMLSSYPHDMPCMKSPGIPRMSDIGKRFNLIFDNAGLSPFSPKS